MLNLSFLHKVMKTFNYRKMLRTVAVVHHRSGKSRILLFCDIVWCGIKYGAGYMDYRYCGFETLTAAQRATYLTRSHNNKLVKMLNQPAYFSIFKNKNEFNTRFKEYIHRDWLDLRNTIKEDFAAFVQNKTAIIAKPVSGSCGKGIEKFLIDNTFSPNTIYEVLLQKQLYIVEDCVVQHADLAAIYPNAVNTLRIVTLLCGEGPLIVYAYIRIGNGGAFVDNINSGGMCAPVNLGSGIITHPAYDKDEKVYTRHPQTDHILAGFQIPYWRESAALCLRAAKEVEQVRYVGWDVCVTQNGPLLLEGNEYPGHDILQLPPHVPNHYGMLPVFQELVKEL